MARSTVPTPTRFVSGIAIDASNPNHAFISFSCYNAYATASGTATGHVFEVTYNPVSHTATWTNLDNNLTDQPITGIALDANTVYGLTIDYAATHGRGAWVLDLSK
jgi:hypothetical protein